MPTYIDDDLDELAEDWDYDEATRPARTVRTARPATVVARSTDRPVTQAQMQMVIGQFNSRIAQNSSAIQRVNATVGTIGRDIRRTSTSVRDTRRDISALRDVTLILPLLQGVVGEDNQQLALLLPFLLLGGIGSSSSDGRSGGYGGLFGGGGSDSLLLILLLTSALGNNSDSQRESRVLTGGK
jgi:hypothetical protein